MKLPGRKTVSFAPFLEEYREYNWRYFRYDVWAALAVALMTIPQSIAYSLLAGLPPIAGLYSAIFGSIFAGALSSSRHLISGPSTGTAILIQTSIAGILSGYTAMSPADQEALTLHILTQIVFLVGLMQVAASFLDVGKLVQFVSRPVILGYFAGITAAIIATQLFYLTGLAPDAGADSTLSKFWSFFKHILDFNTATLLVGGAAFAAMWASRKTYSNLPDALIMLVVGALVAKGLAFWGPSFEPVAKLGQYNLTTQSPLPLIWPFIDLGLINKIFPAAAAISLLAILECSSISRSFAARQGRLAQVNQDVFGLGVANTALSFLYGSMTASGSTSRTALSYRMKAQTRLAAILSGIFTGAIMLFCWTYVKHIPLAALAALLLASVPAFLNWKEIRLCFKATREDAWVFIITFVGCLIFSLDVAFFLGILLSICSFLLKSSTPHLVEYAFNSKGRLIIVNPKETMHRKVRIIGIAGELYFASADVFQAALQSIAEDPRTCAIVLRLNNVYHMDASMCLAILSLYETLQASQRYLVISGLTKEVWHVFHKAGLVKQVGLDNFYFTDEGNPQFSTWKACLRAQDLLHVK